MKAIRWTDDQLADYYQKLGKVVPASPAPKANKFGVSSAPDRTWQGIVFDSRAEMQHYILRYYDCQEEKIRYLGRQVSFPLFVLDLAHQEWIECGTYVADVVYTDLAGQPHIEDVKGYKKKAVYQLFKLKARMVAALYGIVVEEV